MAIPTISYLDTNGCLSPLFKAEINTDILVQGYRIMVLTRHIDERMVTLQRQGTITFAMSALGEEACSVASAAALVPQDWMYPQYRESGIAFWRGFTPLQYVNHMFGNSEDLIYGRQMPNHFGSRELNIVTVSSPIGTKIPHAAGCAYAMKLQKENSVAICYFGEGATSEGDFHAGINFAAVRKAPVIFFCRNNGYAISTPCDHQFACEGIADKGEGYGITTYRIDGNDFFAIYETVKKARAQCLSGKGPVLIEAMTYRMGAHSTSDDPSQYRKNEEVEKWSKKDPILRLKLYLESINAWDQHKEEALQKSVAEETTAAIAAAKNVQRPPLEYMFEHVYFEEPPALRAQYHAAKALLDDSKTE